MFEDLKGKIGLGLLSIRGSAQSALEAKTRLEKKQPQLIEATLAGAIDPECERVYPSAQLRADLDTLIDNPLVYLPSFLLRSLARTPSTPSSRFFKS